MSEHRENYHYRLASAYRHLGRLSDSTRELEIYKTLHLKNQTPNDLRAALLQWRWLSLKQHDANWMFSIPGTRLVCNCDT